MYELERDLTQDYIKKVLEESKKQGSEIIFGFKYLGIMQDYVEHVSEKYGFNQEAIEEGQNQLRNAINLYNSFNCMGSKN